MFRALLPLLTFVVLLAAPVSATWSIVLVNVRTGEVAVASATCLVGLDLTLFVPVIVVGTGAGAAQSFVDPSGQNRIYIRDQLLLGTDPAQILAGLAQRDPSHQTRQYGIVDLQGRAIGFSGTGAGGYAGDRIGQAGDIVYAIQGNVLTGGAVLAAAELAIYNTPGDMIDKLMAAMEAAASFGGDGRCSCAGPTPTSCGAPPLNFTKSADIGFMIVARVGDVDGTCTGTRGCANGSYYMTLNVANQPRSAVDPVVQLRSLLDQWKLSQRGRPDHYLSTASLSVPSLPIDGRATASVTLVLRDREGNQLTSGGANVQVVLDPSSTASVTLGSVRDNGDGSYDIGVTAGTTYGRVLLQMTVDDGSGPRVLAPAYELPISRAPLWTDHTEISASAGGTVRFAVQPGRFFGANHLWVLLASMSGTQPGILIPPLFNLPLNPDALFMATVNAAFSGLMPELLGVTSSTGISSTAIVFPPGMYTLPIGADVSFAYALLNPVTLTSNPVTVRIVR